jgi:hypothetical protein
LPEGGEPDQWRWRPRDFLLLPDNGIPGNSHMMMMDKNNLRIAGLIRKWIGEQVR